MPRRTEIFEASLLSWPKLFIHELCRWLFYLHVTFKQFASQVALEVKNPPDNAGDKRCRINPWVRKASWSRKWQPTPVFLPGESRGQRA